MFELNIIVKTFCYSEIIYFAPVEEAQTVEFSFLGA